MKRWVIADTHFGHKMLIEKGYRPENYDQRIIENWIKLVGADDLVIHLGDVALPDSNKDVWLTIAGLPGRKILTMGNHDKRSAKWYMERGFAFACEAFELGGVLFTHSPAEIIAPWIRYNVHGHLHAGTHREFTPLERQRLVSLEELGYMPVQVDRIAR